MESVFSLNEILEKASECFKKVGDGECNYGGLECEMCDFNVKSVRKQLFFAKEIKANDIRTNNLLRFKNNSNVGKIAHWVICSEGFYPYCSCCGDEPKGREMTRYCPSCGAFMENNEKPESYIQKQLAEYEKTGLSPEKIIALKSENERLHQLVDFFESVVGDLERSKE